MLAIGIVAVVSAACSSGEPAAPAATQTQAGQQADATAANTATGGEEAEPVVSTGRTGSEKLAPDLKAIDGWINTGAFTLESLRGQIVLVDFWTYTCINCIRTLPYLKDWHDKYAGAGLAIVGVHTPEFEFEKDYDNVLSAVMEYGLKYRIAQDNDYGTWRAFNNRYWPAKYLIDKDGYIRYTHFGEGAYEETEQKIRELLAEAGADLSARAFQALNEREYDPAVYTDDPSMSLTRELYAGYERNYSAAQSRVAPPYVRNLEYYTTPGADLNYNDPGNYENHYIYLQGRWHNGPESIIHSRTTEANEDYIAIKFYGTSANAVMSPPAGGETRVVATLDGMPLTEAQAGLDIMWDDEGRSYILIHSSRMYSIVNIDSFSGHELRLSSNDEGFELFAYTFGGFKGGY
ncbi:MAG: thioredoxin family protein [SAR202 cluster bacterium]|nr:thioredoxin family protein [SAR202 cluster bacterium]